jgi:hypothetical protein
MPGPYPNCTCLSPIGPKSIGECGMPLLTMTIPLLTAQAGGSPRGHCTSTGWGGGASSRPHAHRTRHPRKDPAGASCHRTGAPFCRTLEEDQYASFAIQIESDHRSRVATNACTRRRIASPRFRGLSSRRISPRGFPQNWHRGVLGAYGAM